MSLIALTGVPGSGKSTIARILRSRGAEVHCVGDIAIEKGFVMGTDRARASKEVDLPRLGRFVKGLDRPGRPVFLDGHLSHLLPVKKAIVLRCHPEVLRKRLAARRWDTSKVMENLEAEAMGVITQEAVAAGLDCSEIDVSNIKPEHVASSVLRIAVSKRVIKKFRPGHIDYFEEILKWY